MKLVRGFVAIIAGLAITLVFVQMLDATLAHAVAARPLESLDEYGAVLNTPLAMGARLVYTSLVAVLGGYVCSKTAGDDGLRYTANAATFRAIALVGGAVAGLMPPTSIWMFVPLVIVSTAGMLAGGAIPPAAAAARRSATRPNEQSSNT